ncbi:MAG TPA: peptidylprolyl isomerase [Vitreimonas sp.]|uniref:peptidylprolyl isomerase n=1 Tax=Vitreimonas sp. TaxID=3069702 RepID=UPI002D2BC537|nr:peptidylprolyl isomerase [Vitreimonas sp.]HYD89308.1 peptidylprolyl isomerase [Vitreimonas sp.]
MKHTLIRTIPDEPQAEAFSGCGHGPIPAARRTHNAPPIFVNGAEIAEAEIAREAQNHKAASGPEARAAAARALVIRELLLLRARELGLAPAAATDERGRTETDTEALIRGVFEAEVRPAQPSEAECRRVYESAPGRFTAAALYEASHILFAPKGGDDAAWARAHDEAVAAIAALSADSRFADLARAHSACPTAGQGGSLGQLQRGDLAPEIEDALLSLQPDQIGPVPVRTRHGWHVVRLDRLVPEQLLPFDAVIGHIRAMLAQRAWAAAAARYVADLAANAEIEGLSLSFGGES